MAIIVVNNDKFSQHKWLLAAIITIIAAFQVWSCSLYQPQMTALFLTFHKLEKTTPSLFCLGEDSLSAVEVILTATHGLQARPAGRSYTTWGIQEVIMWPGHHPLCLIQLCCSAGPVTKHLQRFYLVILSQIDWRKAKKEKIHCIYDKYQKLNF